jgi:hypothetical protein
MSKEKEKEKEKPTWKFCFRCFEPGHYAYSCPSSVELDEEERALRLEWIHNEVSHLNYMLEIDQTLRKRRRLHSQSESESRRETAGFIQGWANRFGGIRFEGSSYRQDISPNEPLIAQTQQHAQRPKCIVSVCHNFRSECCPRHSVDELLLDPIERQDIINRISQYRNMESYYLNPDRKG